MKKLYLLLGLCLGAGAVHAQTCVTAFPYTQNFDSFTICGNTLFNCVSNGSCTLAGGWVNASGDSIDWSVNSGTTPSLDTGPSGDHTTGSGQYLYTEASSCFSHLAILETPCFALTAGTPMGVEFWYHMYGARTGTLTVEAFQNNIWTQVYQISGQQQTASSDPWRKATFSLYGYSGNVKLRFSGLTGTDYTSDISIDDFRIAALAPVDLGVTALTSPTGCGLSAATPVTIQVKNFGAQAQTNIPVSYTINGGTPVTATIAGPIAPNATVTYTFPTNANLNATGTYTIVVTANKTGDSDPANNSLTVQIQGRPYVTTFPYLQNFETGQGGWIPGGVNSSWEYGTPAKAVITGAASGTKAWVTGTLTGQYGNSENSFLLGPCFNFTNLVQPAIEMKVWWNSEFSWDGSNVQTSIDNGATWQTVGTVGDTLNWYTDNTVNGLTFSGSQEGWSGRASTSNGSNGYVTVRHLLPGVQGQSNVLIRITFGSDGSVIDDGIAFDDIRIYSGVPTYTKDVGITAITSPVTGCGLSATSQVCVTLVNAGTQPQSNIPITYRINSTPVVAATYAGPLAPGASVNYCFATTANLSTPGTYTVIAFTGLTGDQNAANNTSFTQVTSQPGPASSFTGLAASYCSNNAAVTLTGSPAGGTFSGPGVTGSSFSPAAAGAGTHTISYSVTSGGCTGIATQTTTVSAVGSASIGALNAGYCLNNGPVTLTGSPAGGTFSGPGVTGSAFNPATAGVGTHTITYVVSAGACSGTATKAITVNAVPVVSPLTFANTFCSADAPAALTGTPAGGTFSGTGVNGNMFEPATAGAGTFTLTYSVTNAAGCTASATRPVTVTASPAAAISGLPATACTNGQVATLTGTPAGGSFSGTGVTGSSFDPAAAGAGTYTLTYTVTQGGCTGTATAITTVNAAPVAAITGLPATVCLDSTMLPLTGTPAGGVFSGPGVTGTDFNAATAGIGTHTITYNVEVNGCSGSTTVPVTVDSAVTASFTGLAQRYCANGAAATLTGMPAGGTFFGPGVALGGSSFDPAVAGAGTHTIGYTFMSAAGCTDTAVVTTVVAPAPAAAFTYTNSGSAYSFDAGTSLMGASYSWNFGDGNTGTGITASNTYASSGTYNVQLTVISQDSCVDSVSQVLTVIVGRAEANSAQLQLYPNPTTGQLVLNLNGVQAEQVEIYTLQGQLVRKATASGLAQVQLDLSGLAEGAYLVKVVSRQTSLMRQVILQK